jgi:hypothetical protein
MVLLWLVSFFIVIWAMFQEYKTYKCYEGLSDCGNDWMWEPREGDTVADLVQRIDFGNKADDKIVSRRIIMITAFIAAFLMFWFFKKEALPPAIKFVVVYVILIAVVWFGFRYHESHFLYPITTRTNLSIDELRYSLGLAERPNNVLR